jgi:hypothetical protein
MAHLHPTISAACDGSGGRRALVMFSLIVTAGGAADALAQPRPPSPGGERYEQACAACHGADGRGVTPSILGFDTPVPDFTDCRFVTVEPDEDWLAVSHDGGPARAFDRRMPAFGEALTLAELQETLDHIRGFCSDAAWPRGELNLPRALVTEKAFPENEFVWTMTVAASGAAFIGQEFLYEQRVGSRAQIEIVVPVVAKDVGGWQRGIGDVAVAVKHATYHDAARGHIVSLAAEVVLPTGNESRGLGRGVTVFEPFIAFGQILPAGAFLQAQAGVELPADSDRAQREAFWRTAVGKTLTQGRFGRAWTPLIELLAARELATGGTTHWDVVPQLQVTLNRRQHLMLNAGVRLPVNARDGRHAQVIAYFLWDWFDGGLTDGW